MIRKTKPSDFTSDTKTKIEDFDPDIGDFVAYPLIPKGLTGLLALPGHNKSWLVTQLVTDTVLRKDYLGKYATKRMKVFYIDQDSPTDVYVNRNQRCFRFYGENNNDYDIIYMSMTGFDITRKSDRNDLSDKILYLVAQGYDVLVILDSLNTICGNIDLNRPENATRIMGYIKDLRDAGASVVLVHHISLKKDFTIDVVEPASYVLGSTHIISSLDNSLYLYKPDIKDRVISYLRPISRRTTIPVGIIGVELIEDLPDKLTANIRQIPELPREPTANELMCYKVFPSTKCTVWDIHKRLAGLMTQQETRDAILCLVKEGILISYPNSSSKLMFSLNPNLMSVKSNYKEALVKG